MATVTLQSILLNTLTLLRAARTKRPLRTRWRRKKKRKKFVTRMVHRKEIWYKVKTTVTTQKVFTSLFYCIGIFAVLVKVTVRLSINDFIMWRVQWWKCGSVTVTVGLTEMAEASVESRITQTGSVRSVAATVIGTVTLLVALLSIEALRTACAQETSQQLEKLRSCRGGK